MRLSYAVPTQYVIPKTGSVRAAKVLYKLLDPVSAYSDLEGYESILGHLALSHQSETYGFLTDSSSDTPASHKRNTCTTREEYAAGLEVS